MATSQAKLEGPANLPDVAAIAVIDDAFIPLTTDRLPEQDRGAVLRLLADLDDAPALEDLAARGFDRASLAVSPDAVLEALTDPDRGLGDAFAVLSGASETLATMIEERLSMRRVVAAMRATTRCEVTELQPVGDLPDLNGHQLIFIDYFLEGSKGNGALAERIAKQVEDSRQPESAQQIVLMSSLEKVRTFRQGFRKAAGIDGAAFSFVAKPDLDQAWKVRAHLEMFARALPHSRSIATYINAAKANMEKAQKELAEILDDLDLGDFAYLQNLALHADGHPLGDYLSWLLSSHLASLAFERDLRKEQAVVDAMDFKEEMVSPAEPSTVVATFYHSALFSRHLGPLGPHPRATDADEISDVPLVQLGDVFLDSERTKAIVILSADCDLAYAPSKERKPDKTASVLLVRGTPLAVRSAIEKGNETATHGMEHGSEVYRIEWKFSSYRTIPLGELEAHLRDEGYCLTDRDRLRPLYGLKLQQEFGNHILRVGPPVMPPVRMRMAGEIVRMGTELASVTVLDDDALFASAFKGDWTIRITPTVAGLLREAVAGLLETMKERLEALEGVEQEGPVKKEVAALTAKIKAQETALGEDRRWIDLLGDRPLPATGSTRKQMQGLYFAQGKEWSPITEPAIVLQVTHPKTGLEGGDEPGGYVGPAGTSPKRSRARRPASAASKNDARAGVTRNTEKAETETASVAARTTPHIPAASTKRPSRPKR